MDAELHIDKEMLGQWRKQFAELMREQGVGANATRRVVRGRGVGKQIDWIARSQQRAKSTVVRDRVSEVAAELVRGKPIADPARTTLTATRHAVVAGWLSAAGALDRQGENILAGQVRKFVATMPPVVTDKERIALGLIRTLEAQRQLKRPPEREEAPTR